jgi:hypothetical protein
MSAVSLSGWLSAARATAAATSSAAICWVSASGTRTVEPCVIEATMESANSSNCVARPIV